MRKSKKWKKKKQLQHSAAAAAVSSIDVNGAEGGDRITASAAAAAAAAAGVSGGGATRGSSEDGVAGGAAHNGEVSDIMDDKDSKRGLWKSVKDLRRMLRLVAQQYLTSPQKRKTFYHFPCNHPASQCIPSENFLLSSIPRIRLILFSVADEERTGTAGKFSPS